MQFCFREGQIIIGIKKNQSQSSSKALSWQSALKLNFACKVDQFVINYHRCVHGISNHAKTEDAMMQFFSPSNFFPIHLAMVIIV
jgi:hypothetical protein